MFTIGVDNSPFTLRPKRVFWVDGEVPASLLDMALARGNCVEYIAAVGGAMFVLIDGVIPRPNVPDHAGVPTCPGSEPDPADASRASDGSGV